MFTFLWEALGKILKRMAFPYLCIEIFNGRNSFTLNLLRNVCPALQIYTWAFEGRDFETFSVIFLSTITPQGEF